MILFHPKSPPRKSATQGMKNEEPYSTSHLMRSNYNNTQERTAVGPIQKQQLQMKQKDKDLEVRPCQLPTIWLVN